MQYLLTKNELDSLNGEKKFHDALLAFEKAMNADVKALIESARDMEFDHGARFQRTYARMYENAIAQAHSVLGIKRDPRELS